MRLIYTLSLTMIFLTSMSAYAQNYEGDVVNVSYSYPVIDPQYCSYYEFTINSSTSLNEESLQALKDQYTSSGYFGQTDATLKVASQLKFRWAEQQYDIIGYQEIIEDSEGDLKIFSTSDLRELEQVKIILSLTNDAFWQFYNSEDDPKYSVINQLKDECHDEDGSLNIFKLANIIQSNRARLSDYLIK